jgi:SAM-dependent methyltransferase
MNALARTVELRAYRALAAPLEAPLLDLGCGDGGAAQMLTAFGLMEPPLCGLDLKASDVALAKRTASHRHIVLGDARTLPFPDERFATVIANGVLCCVPQGADAALAEVHRVLRPGGWLVAAVPTDRFTDVLLPSRLLGVLRPLARMYARRVHRRLTHATVASPEDWVAMFERQGFEVERYEPLFSAAAGRPWSLLFPHPLRAFGLLRTGPLRRVGKALSTALFANIFARVYRRDRHAGPPFGYVLIGARRPERRRGEQP